MFRPLLKYFGLFCLGYLGFYLLLNWQPVNQRHAAAFQAVAEKYLKTVFPKAYIAVQPGLRQMKESDLPIAVHFGNQAEIDRIVKEKMQADPQARQISFPTKEFTILFLEFVVIPLTFLWALLLLAPLPWWRKAKSFLLASLFFYVFSLLKLHVYALDYISGQRIGIYEIGTGWAADFFSSLHFNLKIGASMMVATLIWALVVFGGRDWRALLAQMGSPTKK